MQLSYAYGLLLSSCLFLLNDDLKIKKGYANINAAAHNLSCQSSVKKACTLLQSTNLFEKHTDII
jgi:hypothetical protein